MLVSGERGWRLRICLDLNGRGHTMQEVGVGLRWERMGNTVKTWQGRPPSVDMVQLLSNSSRSTVNTLWQSVQGRSSV